MGAVFLRACVVVGVVAAGTQAVLSAQLASAAAQVPAARPDPFLVRLTADEAVRLAAQNNLGIEVERFNPQLSDLVVEQARAAWIPSFNMSMTTRGNTSPNNSFLSGAVGNSTTDRSVTGTAQLSQTVPWGANYSIGWDGVRSTTNSLFSNFSPQLRSSLSLSYSQQLFRGFQVDATRQQVQAGQKQREIADVQLRQTLATTSRTVRNAYWDLVFAVASLRVQQQSLELARESVRNTRARIEIGTVPPIDEVAQLAEEARREEAVITAEAQIDTAEDTLRTLIFKADDPDFWSMRIEPTEMPQFQPTAVDLDAAVRNALERRTDLVQSRKRMEATDINLRYLRDQTRPEVLADFDYGLAGLGGTQFIRAGGGFPGEVVGQTERGFGSVLGDLLTNDYPTWTAALRVTVPVGPSPQQANLTATRLERRQLELQLRNEEVQVAAQVRQAARQVQTNQKRVETTRRARELSERTLEAEQRKLAAGTSQNFQVLQAQRDLAAARNDELRALIDYHQSVVDLETVQDVPLR